MYLPTKAAWEDVVQSREGVSLFFRARQAEQSSDDWPFDQVDRGSAAPPTRVNITLTGIVTARTWYDQIAAYLQNGGVARSLALDGDARYPGFGFCFLFLGL